MEKPSDKFCKFCGFTLEHCQCGKEIFYDRAFICYIYEGLARQGVLSLKCADNLNFAYHVGELLSERIQNEVVRYNLIVPVPMHLRKKLKRGYNQAEIIASDMSKRLNVPLDTKALKIRYSKNVQHTLSKADRLKNAQQLYYAGNSDIKDKYIILVDDIMTTGSTLNVCSNILHSMGAKSVIVAVATSGQLKTNTE